MNKYSGPEMRFPEDVWKIVMSFLDVSKDPLLDRIFNIFLYRKMFKRSFQEEPRFKYVCYFGYLYQLRNVESICDEKICEYSSRHASSLNTLFIEAYEEIKEYSIYNNIDLFVKEKQEQIQKRFPLGCLATDFSIERFIDMTNFHPMLINGREFHIGQVHADIPYSWKTIIEKYSILSPIYFTKDHQDYVITLEDDNGDIFWENELLTGGRRGGGIHFIPKILHKIVHWIGARGVKYNTSKHLIDPFTLNDFRTKLKLLI
jgi:hypothetical protein